MYWTDFAEQKTVVECSGWTTSKILQVPTAGLLKNGLFRIEQVCLEPIPSLGVGFPNLSQLETFEGNFYPVFLHASSPASVRGRGHSG